MSSSRCLAHPHQRVVGICALCLRERLYEVVKSMEPSSDVENAAPMPEVNDHTDIQSQQKPKVNIHPHSQSRKSYNGEFAVRAYPQHASQPVSVRQSNVSECDMKANLKPSIALDVNMGRSNAYGDNDKYGVSAYPHYASQPVSARQSNVSECDMKAKLNPSIGLDVNMGRSNAYGDNDKYGVSAYPHYASQPVSARQSNVSECDMKAKLNPSIALDVNMPTSNAYGDNDKYGMSAYPHYASQPVSARQSNVSECDTKPKLKFSIAKDVNLPTASPSRTSSKKKKSSWFVISKLKPAHGSINNSPDVAFNNNSSSNNNRSSLLSHLSISIGRKSASDAISLSHHSKYRQAYHNSIQVDLETIAEADRSKKSDAGDSSSSWISSFFHKKKSSKFNIRTNACYSDAGSSHSVQPPRLETKVDAGRLSLDGAGFDIQQMLKKKMGFDRAPLQPIEFSNFNSTNEDNAVLQKRKDPMISDEVSSHNAVRQHHRYNEVFSDSENLDSDDSNGRTFSRSRFWRKNWNRTLSPLSYLKEKSAENISLTNQSPASAHDHYHHCQHYHNYQHPGLSIRNHVNLKSSMAGMSNSVQD